MVVTAAQHNSRSILFFLEITWIHKFSLSIHQLLLYASQYLTNVKDLVIKEQSEQKHSLILVVICNFSYEFIVRIMLFFHIYFENI